jgi:hypothetical protein
MRNNLFNIVLIAFIFVTSHLVYAQSDIQQGDILAFDPSRACEVLAIKLEKMKEQFDHKKITITELEEALRSAATPSTKYANILLDYHRTLDQFKSMKEDYDRLVLAQEKHCMPDQDKQDLK